MGSTLGISPKIQDANRLVAESRGKLNNRLNNSGKVVTASENLDLNVPFFEKHGKDILKLIKDTGALSAAIHTLNEAGYEAGPCKITVKGRLWDSKITKPVEEINDQIQNNLDQEVVKTALSTLGIVEEKPVAPFFTMPESPSNATLVKGGAAVAGAVAIGSGIYFRDRIAAATPPSVINGFSTVYSYVPGLPQGVKDAFSNIYSYAGIPQGVKNAFTNVTSSIPSTKDVTDFFSSKLSTVANSQVGVFVGDNKVAIGVAFGAIAAAGIAYAIYRAVENRKSEEA